MRIRMRIYNCLCIYIYIYKYTLTVHQSKTVALEIMICSLWIKRKLEKLRTYTVSLFEFYENEELSET